MERYPDLVPVKTVEKGSRYYGRVYFERLSSIKTVNGQPVSNLEKSFLKHGDSVTYIYRNKTFAGIIDLYADALSESESQDSPAKQDPSNNPTSAASRDKQLSPGRVRMQVDSEPQASPKQLGPSSRRGKRPQTLLASPRKKVKLAGLPKKASKKAGWQKSLGLASYLLENVYCR